ncbi:hypothetical protein [Sabulicella glaciei]|uniref:Uncharacterized protein n=1 Tax=Sabulicella glaciei TaxID=2984948 RepID=A0ABT3P1E9_9PROT|nr:hypothetical protein [Roseococcus sp. MDT2-1-1]MCW8088249.1 hypothetical protein [Roseococcus sp. MDT2-1-1]
MEATNTDTTTPPTPDVNAPPHRAKAKKKANKKGRVEAHPNSSPARSFTLEKRDGSGVNTELPENFVLLLSMRDSHATATEAVEESSKKLSESLVPLCAGIVSLVTLEEKEVASLIALAVEQGLLPKGTRTRTDKPAVKLLQIVLGRKNPTLVSRLGFICTHAAEHGVDLNEAAKGGIYGYEKTLKAELARANPEEPEAAPTSFTVKVRIEEASRDQVAAECLLLVESASPEVAKVLRQVIDAAAPAVLPGQHQEVGDMPAEDAGVSTDDDRGLDYQEPALDTAPESKEVTTPSVVTEVIALNAANASAPEETEIFVVAPEEDLLSANQALLPSVVTFKSLAHLRNEHQDDYCRLKDHGFKYDGAAGHWTGPSFDGLTELLTRVGGEIVLGVPGG